ncbi:hypothetical protein HYH02_015172 [Chlamydomonas schloesseri]|uniref:Dihydroxyacetone kinase n=1 Tax=Chlamydomonas schloesseri TaxID=2026947 RepID=A0A835SGN7_9CHLO|nr:hypothetical protein HYH02_015172 [Chlamydomonas schloesseri]|eukprot:KAG2424502.1 hypothetical protein HYH02_015172 [Chlamydomonas schloesseri]
MTHAKKQLINSPETVVVEALEGLCLSHTHLQLLEGSPQIKVVINKNHDKSKVALISGGGSGHEPAHAGYVGDGMLAAAVCGDVFASPSTAAVLAAIRAVTGPGGCLLIVKNYTGDRLNFGLAAEQALSEGYSVEVVVVGEDVAIDAPSRLTGRRGLAGTVLVHKAAGAAAARGAPLCAVAALAARVSDHLATLGVGLTPCTLPGKPTPERLAPDEIEIGLGIHGEPGRASVRPPPPAAELVTRMVKQIASGSPFFKLPSSSSSTSSASAPRLALLVNNLGGTPPLELSLVAGAALTAARADLGAVVDRVYVGPFMTSLDMAGMSLTLLSYDMDPEAALQEAAAEPGSKEDAASASSSSSWAHLLQLLDDPTSAPGWPYRGPALPGAFDPASLAAVRAPLPAAASAAAGAPGPGAGGEAVPPLPAGGLSAAAAALGRALRGAAGAVVAAEAELDDMDAKVGDGDCGATLAGGGRAVLAALDGGAVPLHSAPAAAAAVAAAVRGAVGGSSGALYDILLTAAARQLKSSTQPQQQLDASPRDWAEALSAGLAAVQKYGRADVGCRTMLDALLPARDAALAAVERGESGVAAAEAAAAAAEAGAESTRGMAAAAGRASYVPAEVLASVPDPGAVAAARWLRAVATALKA